MGSEVSTVITVVLVMMMVIMVVVMKLSQRCYHVLVHIHIFIKYCETIFRGGEDDVSNPEVEIVFWLNPKNSFVANPRTKPFSSSFKKSRESRPACADLSPQNTISTDI